jgi:hypothetical protein
MRRGMRQIVRVVDRWPVLTCGHYGDFARLNEIGKFRYCACCAMPAHQKVQATKAKE